MRYLSLGPAHPAMTYEACNWGRKSTGSHVLRRILAAFSATDGPEPTKRPFDGSWTPAPSRVEGTVLEMLRNGPMGENKAKRAADTIDSERRLPPRAAFVELLAAPAALFPLEMEKKMRPAQPHTNSSFPSRRRREWNGCSTARGTEQP